MSALPSPDSTARLHAALARRILLIDGGMGTMIQQHDLTEADFRGDLLAHHPHDLKGNNDLLALTRPELIRDIHRAYFEAGADIVETNTFNSTVIAQADYHLEAWVPRLNEAAARLAKEAATQVMAADPARTCFVAGSIGPTNRTASMSPDVNNPGYRAVTFSQLAAAYLEQARALLAGGADLLLIETVFDTLNAKAALFALEQLFDELGHRVPIMISGTITDASGRTLSGQTVEAFWHSIAHARPLSIGLNCALGPVEMRPYVETLSRIAPCHLSVHPNAGLPNAFGGYDLDPATFASQVAEFASEGWLNLAGGCCGTGPDHIRALRAALAPFPPRPLPLIPPSMRLSGLEPLTVS